MLVCSWDVGIKNLSYCKFKIENKKIEILDWDVINIFEDDNKTCCGIIKKSGELCGKNALYLGEIGNKYYCGTHKSQYNNKYKNTIFFEKDIDNNNKCEYMNTKNIKCDKKSKWSHKDIVTGDREYYCSVHKKWREKKVEQIVNAKKIKRESVMKKDVQETGESMYKELNKRDTLFGDLILIENQPMLKNPSMGRVAAFLFSYYVSKKVNEGKKIGKIKYISASNKLKLQDRDKRSEFIKRIIDNKETSKLYKLISLTKEYNKKLGDEKIKNVLEYVLSKNIIDKENNDEIKKLEKNNRYKINKAMGIEYCKYVLEKLKLNNWIKIIEKFKKQDDMADSFLQGYYHLNIFEL